MFSLGQLVTTSTVRYEMNKNLVFAAYIAAYVKRHAKGDWGDLCDSDKQLNDDSVAYKRKEGNLGERLLSAYTHPDHDKIYIITEWDESVTTVLFADEY